jgi:hypothetical protein
MKVPPSSGGQGGALLNSNKYQQTRMINKALSWVEAGAYAVRKRPKRGGMAGVCAGVAWRSCQPLLAVLSLTPLGLFGAASFLYVTPRPTGGGVVCKAPLISF